MRVGDSEVSGMPEKVVETAEVKDKAGAVYVSGLSPVTKLHEL